MGQRVVSVWLKRFIRIMAGKALMLKKVLTPGQKRLIKRLLTPGQMRLVKKLLGAGQKSADYRIAQLRYRLYNLGFTDRALADLWELAVDNPNPVLRRAAAWELALWHANRSSRAGARQCLELLPGAKKEVNDPEQLRRIAVVKAECNALLGNLEAAKEALKCALEAGPQVDLFLAAANLEPALPDRIAWINKALALHGKSAITFYTSTKRPAFDCLSPGRDLREYAGVSDQMPKVSVIIPAYNSESTIQTALESLRAQTWANLEILVVDDASTDNTTAVAEEYANKDSRIRLIKSERNGGTYVARNLALKAASGDFVTCHDADDWSHPEKIESQALHLLQNPAVVANTSQQARATADLKFYRKGNPGYYIQTNTSSFMFYRKPVMEAVGYWDCVRFGADDEFIQRVKKVFGGRAVVLMQTGPLCFQRQTSDSLTGNEAFGYHGFLAGVRREYVESFQHFHSNTDKVHYGFQQESRCFHVPEPLWPIREVKHSGVRHFDLILASDFRLPGGTTASNVEEIKAQKKMGLRTGLIQMPRYKIDPQRQINLKIRELLDSNRVQMIVYGEKVSCDLLFIKHPPVLQERQRYVPEVAAGYLGVIINQTPMHDYGKNGVVSYNIKQCVEHLKGYFGQSDTWHPIGPLIRKALHRYHEEELSLIELANDDWVEIIDVGAWRRPSRPPRRGITRIGRHSRDDSRKWPANPGELLAAYPYSGKYEVHVLGGAEAPRKVLGRLPRNWRVQEFGAVRPEDFLASLDVFVYYTHHDMVEAFGRVIIEAMAAGVPVILPRIYRELFGEAAIYAEPSAVRENIDRLMGDDAYYESQVEKARHYVEKHFGHARHTARLEELLGRKC